MVTGWSLIKSSISMSSSRRRERWRKIMEELWPWDEWTKLRPWERSSSHTLLLYLEGTLMTTSGQSQTVSMRGELLLKALIVYCSFTIEIRARSEMVGTLSTHHVCEIFRAIFKKIVLPAPIYLPFLVKILEKRRYLDSDKPYFRHEKILWKRSHNFMAIMKNLFLYVSICLASFSLFSQPFAGIENWNGRVVGIVLYS